MPSLKIVYSTCMLCEYTVNCVNTAFDRTVNYELLLNYSYFCLSCIVTNHYNFMASIFFLSFLFFDKERT